MHASTISSPSSSSSAEGAPIPCLLQAVPCGCLLLRDGLEALGHFLLPWITAAALQQGHSVVLVAAAYSPTKHRSALRKIGAPGVAGAVGSSSSGDASSSSSMERIAFVTPLAAAGAAAEGRSPVLCLQQLYQQVEAAARQLLGQQEQQQEGHQQPRQQQQQQQPQGLTVLLDSLACLSCLVAAPNGSSIDSQGDSQGDSSSSSSSGQLGALLHYLLALGERLQVCCRLVLLASRDTAADAALLAAAAAQADVIADVAALEGRTAALDGRLTISVRQAAAAGGGGAGAVPPGQQRPVPGWCRAGGRAVWFFRAGDTAVKWLPAVHGKELMAG